MGNEVRKNGSIKYYYQNGRFYQFFIKAKVQVVHQKIKTALESTNEALFIAKLTVNKRIRVKLLIKSSHYEKGLKYSG